MNKIHYLLSIWKKGKMTHMILLLKVKTVTPKWL
jgi:hypothetical protein